MLAGGTLGAAEHARQLIGDRDASAGQGKDQNIGAAAILLKLFRQPATGIVAVAGELTDVVLAGFELLGRQAGVVAGSIELPDRCDAVFSGLPHGTAQDLIKDLPQDLRVIDMSADFRLLDAEKAAGIELTDSFAMLPASSVAGFYLSLMPTLVAVATGWTFKNNK